MSGRSCWAVDQPKDEMGNIVSEAPTKNTKKPIGFSANDGRDEEHNGKFVGGDPK